MVKRSLGFDLHAAQPSRSRSDSPSALAAVSEDTIGVALMHGSGGLVAVARPMVDLGFDLYARRLGTMRIVPIQVKARASLDSMRGYRYFNYLLASKALQRDPSGFLIFTYVSWHRPEAFETVLAIPIPYFVRHCSRVVEDGVEYTADPTARWTVRGSRPPCPASRLTALRSSTGTSPIQLSDQCPPWAIDPFEPVSYLDG